jgi:hypothetical protein
VEIDGRDFRTLDEFFEVIGAVLVPGEAWGKNLDAFNDILCWPLVRDPEPYVLVWRWSNLSRWRLNHGETDRYWEAVIQAGNKPSAWQAEQRTRAGPCEGPTAFDWLVEIIQRHPDWLSLRLE